MSDILFQTNVQSAIDAIRLYKEKTELDELVANTLEEFCITLEKSINDPSSITGYVDEYLEKLNQLGFSEDFVVETMNTLKSVKTKENNVQMKKIKVEKMVKIPGTNMILDRGDKIFYYGKKSENFRRVNEAFKAGSAGLVAKKMCNIIGNKIGCKLEIFGFPMIVENDYGKKITYYGKCSGKVNKIFGVCFDENGSDEITAFYFFENRNDFFSPTRIVDLQGFNIVQVIGQICDVFTGAFDKYYEGSMRYGNRFIENIDDDVSKWLNSNKNWVDDLKNSSLDAVSATNDFLNFCKNSGLKTKTCSTDMIKFRIGRYCRNNNISYKKSALPIAQVNDINQTSKVLPLLNPEDEALFESVLHTPAVERWHHFLDQCERILTGEYGDMTLIAYGSPGTGKTKELEIKIMDEGLEDSVGWVVGTKLDTIGIIKDLYKNKDKDVVIFDDCDNAIGSGNRANIFKQIMLPTKKARFVSLDKSIFMSTDDLTDVEFDDDAIQAGKVKLPSIFEFKGRIIFLSNKPRSFFDPALLSRVLQSELLFSREEMMELIMSKIDKLGGAYGITLKECPHDDRVKVWNLIDKFKERIELQGNVTINCRLFELALQGWLIGTRAGLSDTELERSILKNIITARSKDLD